MLLNVLRPRLQHGAKMPDLLKSSWMLGNPGGLPIVHHHRYPSKSLCRALCASPAKTLIKRAYPRYSVLGEKVLLSVSIIMPKFRMVKDDGLATDNKNRGRLLMGFTPRDLNDGRNMWDESIRFALDAEECGLMCSQLPHYDVELSRSMATEANRAHDVSSEMPDKVFRAVPGDGATIALSVDYVKNGIGGQSPGPGQTNAGGPLEIVLQAGEAQVVLAIMKSAIPVLIGWDPLVEYSVNSAIEEGVNDRGYGGRYNGSEGGSIPF